VKLSVVSTLYYSAKYVPEFYSRVSKAAALITEDYEIIFVDDGSPDDSAAVVAALIDQDKKVKLVQLSRNFGHHKAIVTGLSYANGDYIFLVDCDLEEPPELLQEFYEPIKNDPSLGLVIGTQAVRRGGWIDRYVAGLYYALFNFWSSKSIPSNQLIARLMTKNYLRSLLAFKEHDYVLAGICALAGHKQVTVEVKKGHKGETTYNPARKIALMVDSITSFSVRPLELIFILGMLISALSLILIAVLLYKKFVLGITLEGWVSIVASIWFIGGIVVFCQGVLGIYTARIFLQVKNRPFTLVSQTYNLDKRPTRDETEMD
jgi:putative glycosyltransferase